VISGIGYGKESTIRWPMPSGLFTGAHAHTVQRPARCSPPRTGGDRRPRRGVPSATRVAGAAGTSGWPRGSPGAVWRPLMIKISLEEQEPYAQRNGQQYLVEMVRCDLGARQWRQSDLPLRWVVPGQVDRQCGIPVETGCLVCAAERIISRQPRPGLRSRTAMALIRHTTPSRSVARWPSRPGRRLPRRPGTPRRPERSHATPGQAPTPRGDGSLIRKKPFVTQCW
jgi:hypothetical protein